MTVSTNMHTTLAGLESAKASLKTFALQTEDKTAKQMFAQYSQQQSICQGLASRINYIGNKSQYKIFQYDPTSSSAQQMQQKQENKTIKWPMVSS